MRNFADVTRDSDELLELNLIEILSIFGDDELNVKNEEVVWEAAIRWIDHNPENRNIYIVNLLRQIRTGLMETQYFMEHVKDHTYVHGNEGCRPIIIETLRFLYVIRRLLDMPSYNLHLIKVGWPYVPVY